MRQQVMYPNHSIDFVKLEDDESGKHLGLYNDSELISVISLFERGRAMQFRKFATRADRQGRGYGSVLLRYAIDRAIAKGFSSIWCNARVNAASLYERFGFHQVGEGWQQWGIDFVKMEKQLDE